MWVTSVDFNYLPKKKKKNWQENMYSVPNSVVLEKWIICIFSILLISSQGYFHFEKKPESLICQYPHILYTKLDKNISLALEKIFL